MDRHCNDNVLRGHTSVKITGHKKVVLCIYTSHIVDYMGQVKCQSIRNVEVSSLYKL